MKLGIFLHALWHTRKVLVASLLIGLAAAVLSTYRVSPAGLHPRAISMATASTQVMVDNPYSIVFDLNQGSYQLQQMAQSATFLGNVMVSLSVQEDVARRIGIRVSQLQTTAPATPLLPQAIPTPQNRKTTDILASNNQYRISVQANPTVPILTIYTEASSVATAKALANAAVDSLRDYLSTAGHGVPAKERVNIDQLGRAQGGAVTGGLRQEVPALAFVFAFVLSSALGMWIIRISTGWQIAAGEAGRAAVQAADGGAHPA